MTPSIRHLLFLSLATWLGMSGANAEAPANAIDQVTLHPAIPLVDTQGANVLDSGEPYSPRMSCGIGSGGCHDYDGISHGNHFERGRDETDDSYGAKRGLWSHLSSPGYFGGFNSQGPAILAKKSNGGADPFPADWGAAGMVMACIECHDGGGWSELDRDGIRYDQKLKSAIAAWDGDYYNRGTSTSNQPANASVVSQWDWSLSGVVENDCLMCHGDYSRLKSFPDSVIPAPDPFAWYVSELGETPSAPFGAWWKTRNVDLVKSGHFRDAATALLEFIDTAPETAEGRNLVRLSRSASGDLVLNDGKPVWLWKAEAFDPVTRKVQIPMRKFPANDNCWQCHGNAVGQDRRGFWGYGPATTPPRAATPGPGGNARPKADGFDYRMDVHKGAKFTDDNGVERVIDNCNACHTQGIYYRELDTNVDLNADHHFAKGNSDIDIRRDLDFRPAPKSCEFCHDQAQHKANPSDPPGKLSLAAVHLQRWTQLGYMVGYSGVGLINTHLNTVACQSCHIAANLSQCDVDATSAARAACDTRMKTLDGGDLPILYRSRISEDGKLKSVPFNPKFQFRYYWRDKTSGRILTQQELDSVYSRKKDAGGQVTALLLTAKSGKQFELSGGQGELQGSSAFYDWGPQFKQTELYDAVQALKAAYDQVLVAAGYGSPNVQMIWTESNSYLITHGTQPVETVLPCQGCHDRTRSGTWNGALKGIYGDKKQVVLNSHTDKRLVDAGIVVFDKPYYKATTDGKIIANETDILYVSQNNPSMTALLADKAPLSEGELAVVGLDEALSRMAATDVKNKAALAPLLGSSEQLVFNPVTAQDPLKRVCLATSADASSKNLLSGLRFGVNYRAHTTVDSRLLAKSRLGNLASDVYGLTVRSPQRHLLSALNERVWVKLPYLGNMCSAGQVDVVDLTTLRKAEGNSAVLIKPKDAPGKNWLVLSTDRPLAQFALADRAASPRAAFARAKSALANSNRTKAAAEKTATRLRSQLAAADAAALAANAAATQAQADFDAASDAEKLKLLPALNKAKNAAVTAAVKANEARSRSQVADTALTAAVTAQQAANQVYTEAQRCVK